MAISKYGNYIGKPTRGVKRTAKEHNMKISHVVEELIEKHIVNSNQE